MKKVKLSTLVVPGQTPPEAPSAPPAAPAEPPPLAVAEGPPRAALGPPPAPAEAPSGYAGFVAAALKARANPKTSPAEFWAALAQADALDRIARALEGLAAFAGAYDAHDEGYDARLADVVAEGLVNAVDELKDRALGAVPPELLAEFKAQLVSSLAERTEKKPAKKKS